MPLRLLPGAFDEVRQGIVGLSNDGLIISANRAAEAIFGHAADELVGRSIEFVMPEPLGSAHAGFWKDFWSNPVSGPIGDAGEAVIGIRKNGVPVPLEVTLSVVGDLDSTQIVASIADITQRVRLESQMPPATDEHLPFQRLIADIATGFANIKPAAVDGTIVTSLGQLGEALRFDRVILWRYKKGEANAVPTHYWIAPGHNSPPRPHLMASLPWVFSNLMAGKPCWFTTLDQVPDPVDRETFRLKGSRSGAVLPLPGYEDDVVLALVFSSMTQEQQWTPALIERLRLVASIVGQALAHKASLNARDQELDELHKLRRHQTDEDIEPRREVKTPKSSNLIVSDSAVVRQAFLQVEQVATTPSTVLLLGETGAGKEVFAQAIHDLSPAITGRWSASAAGLSRAPSSRASLQPRARRLYGALSRQIGRFEAANQSTLFLDEIGELQPEVQVKLLRVLQERVIERLGSTQPIKVDVRIIAATHRDLEKAVVDGTFRQDLFYRLNVFPIVVPPLRDRTEDIPGLVWAFIDEFSRAFGKTIESVSKESMKELQRYAWPGNVRELRNVVERAVIVATGTHLVVQAPRPLGRTTPQAAMTLEALEVEHIRSVLEGTNWRVRGSGGAAARLGLKPTTLESRMAKLGIARKASR